MFVAKFSLYLRLSRFQFKLKSKIHSLRTRTTTRKTEENRSNPKIVARNVLKGLDESAAGDRNVVYGDDRLN